MITDRNSPQLREDERGSGTVLALGLIAVLLLLAVAVAGLIGVVSANQRAATAADLAALAAADAARGLASGEPCGRAQTVAETNEAELIGCAQPEHLPGTVDVRVQSKIHGPFKVLGSAESMSRAGPPPSSARG